MGAAAVSPGVKRQTRSAIVGAVVGAVLGAASMIVPIFIRRELEVPVGVTVFIVVGTAALGAVFFALNADAR